MLGSAAYVVGARQRSSKRYYYSHTAKSTKKPNALNSLADAPDLKSTEDLNFPRKKTFWKGVVNFFLRSDVYSFSFLVYGIWIALGILFYTFYDKYTTATAYYYAIEAGLSIGFCSPAEINDWSKLFTIFYVMIASTLVSGALGIFINISLYQAPVVVPVAHRIGAITWRDFETNKVTSSSIFICIMYHIKYLSGWYTNRPRTILVLIFLFWIGLGCVYGMLVEKWTFITALYWSVTSCATGGLETPKCISSNASGTTCNMGDFRGTIMGMYMMFGVPLYAATLGQFASLAVFAAHEANKQSLLRKPINDADFLLVANLLSPEGSETLVLGEFILLELLRLGRANYGEIDSFKQQFDELDTKKTGLLDIEQMREAGIVIDHKAHLVETVTPQKRRSSFEDIVELISSPRRNSIPSERPSSPVSSPSRLDSRSSLTNNDSFSHIARSPRALSTNDHAIYALNAANERQKWDILSQLWRIQHYIITNIYLFCFLSYSLWIALGILFYHFFNNWTVATAFYFVMDAGLSVGFCYPAEKDDWSKLFTIFFVLLGSSVISGGLGLFASVALSDNANIIIIPHELNEMAWRDTEGRLTLFSVSRAIWYNLKYSFGWFSNRPRAKLTILCLIWIGLGCVYGMLVEEYSFITALYWAITTCSTGGLQSPPCKSYDDSGTICNMGDFRGSIMGVFMMIGIPLYALTMGQYGMQFVIHVAINHEMKSVANPIDEVDFLFAANVLSQEGSETLVVGEFILLELMRLGRCRADEIEDFKAKFKALDIDRSGELDINEMIQAGIVVPRKIHSVEINRRLDFDSQRASKRRTINRHSIAMLSDEILEATAKLQKEAFLKQKMMGNANSAEIEMRDLAGSFPRNISETDLSSKASLHSARVLDSTPRMRAFTGAESTGASSYQNISPLEESLELGIDTSTGELTGSKSFRKAVRRNSYFITDSQDPEALKNVASSSNLQALGSDLESSADV